MWLRNYITLTQEGLYFVLVAGFIFTGALLRDINLLFVLSGMMLGLLVTNFSAVLFLLRRIEVVRMLPEQVHAGDDLIVQLKGTTSAKCARWAIVVEDRLSREEQQAEDSTEVVYAMFPKIPVGEPASTHYRGRLMLRGRYHFGPLRIATRFPLGLVSRVATLQHHDTLVVLPRLGRLQSAWYRLVTHGGRNGTIARKRFFRDDGEFYGLRDWASGDSRRWIHWRSTARRGQLTVRQYEPLGQSNLCLLVDLWQPEGPDDAQQERIEDLISLAATAVVDACQQRCRLTVAIAGQDPRLLSGTGSMTVRQEILEALAEAKTTSKDRLPQLLADTEDQVSIGTQLIVASTRPLDIEQRIENLKASDGDVVRSPVALLTAIDMSANDAEHWFHSPDYPMKPEEVSA